MVNKEKIRLMNKMALYEEKQGSEDMKISSYYKKDYTSLQTIWTLIWITVGYGMIIGLLVVTCMDGLLENAGLFTFVILILAVLIVYLLLMAGYGIFASRYYQKKYAKARGRVKKYHRMLMQLERFYDRERKKK